VDLSEFIRRERDAIVAAWESKVRDEIVRRDLTPEQLLDDLHLLIDQVIEELELSSGRLVEGGRSAVARAHGRQRHTVRHELADVVREYGLLFEAVVELSERLGIELYARDVLNLSRCLYTGAAQAAEEFALKSDAERRRADFEFFAFLAHEIRNPLSSARMAWELGRRTGEITGASVNRLERSLSSVADLVNHTLLQSRLTMVGSGAQLNVSAIPVEQLLKEAHEDSALEAEHKRIAITIESESGLLLRGDRRLLRSALSNLLRNAVKFTRAEGTVALRARTEDGHLHLDIDDECGGLEPERAERLFDSFVQGDSADRSGFGLGLAIARQALEAHRGTVSVKNRPGAGCTFSIELPFEIEDPGLPDRSGP
jgi:signal transduction histidine kinase